MKIKAQRYEDENLIFTNHDFLEELVNYISIFKSKEFTSDILKNKHKFTNSNKIKEASAQIKLHMTLAIDLIHQALESKPELSYLPFYYACLNLIKCHLIALKKGSDLQKNKLHGMKYNDNPSTKNFLNEELKFFKKGTIPLYYQYISGKLISNRGIRVKLDDVYRNIANISAEYQLSSNNLVPQIILKTKTFRQNGKITFQLIKHTNAILNLPEPRYMPALNNFKLSANKQYYQATKTFSTLNAAQNYSNKNINKFYIDNYYCQTCQEFHLKTIESRRRNVFSEDLSIALAFYHLSNMVRYNPEHFYRILDSKNYPMIMALRKNGIFTILKSMTGHLKQETFEMNFTN